MSSSIRPALPWALILVGLLAALTVLWERSAQEEGSRGVILVLDHRAVEDQARAAGRPVEELLREFRVAGVGSVALGEWTVEELVGRGEIRLQSGWELAEALGRRQGPGRPHSGPAPRPDRLYVVARSPALADELRRGLGAHLGPDRVLGWPPGESAPEILEVLTDLRTLNASGLGIPRALARRLHEELGFSLWLRPENNPDASPEELEARLQGLLDIPGTQGVIFAGARNEALGYPLHLDRVADRLVDAGVRIGVIELPVKAQQKGIAQLVRRRTEGAVRVLALAPAHQARLHPDAVAAMYGLGARERNLRVLYIRPYLDWVEKLSPAEANARLLQRLGEELGGLGAAAPGTFPTSAVSHPLAWSLSALGLGGALLRLAGGWGGAARMWGVALLVGVTLATSLGAPGGGLWRAALAWLAATVFPVLALTLVFPWLDRARASRGGLELLGLSGRALCLPLLLTTAGGLISASFLPETTYLLALDTFRGVKLHGALVPALGVALFLAWGGGLRRLGRLLEQELRVWHLLVFLAVAGLGLVYLARTGNEGMPVSEWERSLRRGLDAWLGVRPRFKEFLFGHPALMLAPVLAWRGWRWGVALALLAGGVGLASVSDTYAHLHTPLAVSWARTWLGAALGAAMGGLGAWLLIRLPLPRPQAGPGAPVSAPLRGGPGAS